MTINIPMHFTWPYDFTPGAAEEFQYVMSYLGYNIAITPERGSHGAEFWVPTDEAQKFKDNILGNPIEGWFRNFYTSTISGCGGVSKSDFNFFYVSYKKH